MAMSALKFAKIEDSDLVSITGGMGADDTEKSAYCPDCNEHFRLTTDKKPVKCPHCGKVLTL